jgi:predicted thioesterase
MRDGLVPGRTGEVEITVTPAMVAQFDELGLVHPVYATWTLVKHMEEASRKMLLPFLEEDEEAVGHAVNVVHLAPTPVGMRVRVRAVLDRVDGRRIHCRLEASNERERIGEGTTIQIVVSRTRLREQFRALGTL